MSTAVPPAILEPFLDAADAAAAAARQEVDAAVARELMGEVGSGHVGAGDGLGP